MRINTAFLFCAATLTFTSADCVGRPAAPRVETLAKAQGIHIHGITAEPADITLPAPLSQKLLEELQEESNRLPFPPATAVHVLFDATVGDMELSWRPGHVICCNRRTGAHWCAHSPFFDEYWQQACQKASVTPHDLVRGPDAERDRRARQKLNQALRGALFFMAAALPPSPASPSEDGSATMSSGSTSSSTRKQAKCSTPLSPSEGRAPCQQQISLCCECEAVPAGEGEPPACGHRSGCRKSPLRAMTQDFLPAIPMV